MNYCLHGYSFEKLNTEILDIHYSGGGVTLPNLTLPPVDYSFQFAPLTRAGSNPSQFNRFQKATVSQTKLPVRASEAIPTSERCRFLNYVIKAIKSVR